MPHSFSHHDWRERIDGLPFHRHADRIVDDVKDEFGDEFSDEWIERAQQVSQCDGVLAEALSDISVPDGLAVRLKATLAQASPATTSSDGGLETDAEVEMAAEGLATPSVKGAESSRSPIRSQSHRRPTKRRRVWLGWIAASLMICLIASGATIAYVVLNQPPDVISRDHLAHESMEWKLAVDQQEWTPGLPPQVEMYPVSQDVLTRPQRWMTLDTPYDAQTVVYDLTPPGQKQVLQFTLRTSREFNLNPVLPTEPIYKTGSFCIGASYLDGVLYVVFVEGDAQRYRDVIWEVGPAG